MQVLFTHTGWFLAPMGHGSRATFIDRVQAPDKFHLAIAMKSLLHGDEPEHDIAWAEENYGEYYPASVCPTVRCMWPRLWHPLL